MNMRASSMRLFAMALMSLAALRCNRRPVAQILHFFSRLPDRRRCRGRRIVKIAVRRRPVPVIALILGRPWA
jgi:hypothetical protein